MAIVNPSGQDATITVTAYGVDGQPLTGISNPVEIMVPANQQLARLTSEIFSGSLDASTVGWFQASSLVDDLTGFFLFLDGSITLLDGADLPLGAEKIIFNRVRLDGNYTTELNIVNPGETPADVELQLIIPDTPALNKTILLAPKGVARLDVGDFFEVGTSPSGTYISVIADTEVAGFQFVRSPDGDLLGMNARSASEQLTHLFFPQMVVLGPWKTKLGLINYSAQSVIVTVSAYQPDGSLYGVENLENNPVTRSLNPEESLVEDLEVMFGFSGQDELDGWIQVEATSAAINGFISYGISETGSAAAVTSESAGRTKAIFSHLATTEDFFTGVAILNSGALTTNLRILALKPDGEILGSFDTVLQPGERLSKLIHELVPEAIGQAGGLIWISSQLPVYMTSLFGTPDVLANVPSQPSPDSYLPDADLASLNVTPALAIIQPNGSQGFQVESSEDVTWKVNGIMRGEATVGTISQSGIYQAPAQVPSPQAVTVSAETNGQAAGASVDILEKESLISALGFVQSVAYLDVLKRLYTAELSILGPLGESIRALRLSPAQTADSVVFEVAPGVGKVTIRDFPGEEITKMIPFSSSGGQEFLLLAGRSGGRVIRLDPLSGESTDVATGLDRPNTLVLDPVTDTLLVAEQTRITSIPRTQLESGLVQALRTGPPENGNQAVTLLPTRGADGITVDSCTGNIYFWDTASNQIRQYVRATEEVNNVGVPLPPGQLLGFYRFGIACPFSFRLLVAGRAAPLFWLVNPMDGSVRSWLVANQPTDVSFLPGGTPLSDQPGVLFSEIPGGSQGRIGFIGTPQLYSREPTNPPERQQCLGSLLFTDLNLDNAVRFDAGLGSTDPFTCQLASQVREIDVSNSDVRILQGLQVFKGLRSLLAFENLIQHLNPLADITGLLLLDLRGNAISDLRPLSRLSALRVLRLGENRISELGPLFRLPRLSVLELNDNSIEDIRPLVANQGLGAEDRIDLQNNPLDTEDCPDILLLQGRGVEVVHDLQCAE